MTEYIFEFELRQRPLGSFTRILSPPFFPTLLELRKNRFEFLASVFTVCHGMWESNSPAPRRERAKFLEE